jgi:Protein of unknown function (DUF2752)
MSKQVNLNAVVIYAITSFITIALLGLCIIPSLEALVKIPDLSLSRRIGVPYSPTYGLTRAIWCVLHGKLNLAVKYNRFIFLFFPILAYQYLLLSQQCFRYSLYCDDIETL